MALFTAQEFYRGGYEGELLAFRNPLDEPVVAK